MGESLCCPPEIITLLTGYTPIQNKKLKLWREKPPKTEGKNKAYMRSSVTGVDVISLGRPHRFWGFADKHCFGVSCKVDLSAVLGEGTVSRAQRPQQPGRWGWPAYLVAVGAGAAVQLCRVPAARAVVLARAGEAGVALGHNVDVHWP